MRTFLISLLSLASSLHALWPLQEDALIIQIKTQKTSNAGMPFYVFVKPTTFAQFIKEDYQQIVAEKVQSGNLQEGFAMTCLIPGETQLLTFPMKERQSFALYCLLSSPGKEWKYFIDAEGPSHIKILLGQNEIQTTSRF